MDIKKHITALGFVPKNGTNGIYHKTYVDYAIEIDFEKQNINYGNIIIAESRTTQNFSQPENFVVLECVDRLLLKGYKPQNIVLEKTWPSGHGTSGRLDICVNREDGTPYMLIECKTYGKEYNKELTKIHKDGGQLFTYFQLSGSKADVIMLYASELKGDKYIYVNEIIKIEDDYRNGDVKDIYEKWNKLTKDNGIFDSWVQPYNFQSKALTKEQLKEIKAEDSSFIFNRFLEILRHNVVSDKGNAFNKIFTLFLCKVYDETTTGEGEELKFQWLEGRDNHVDFQLRLTDLYSKGMKKFLDRTVSDFNNEDFDKRCANLNEDTKQYLLKEVNKLRLEKNNEFAIKEVYDNASFEENAKVVKEVVELIQEYRIRYNKRQQYLSDFFELLLTTGLKQEAGQYFTPVPIAQFIIKSLPLDSIMAKKLSRKDGEILPYMIDYAAGSGHFITEFMHEIQDIINNCDTSKYIEETRKHLVNWQNCHFDWATGYVYGIEKDYRLVKVGKVGCYLHGDGLANVILSDGLANFCNNKEYKGKLRKLVNDGQKDNQQFDIVLSNPPYSVSSFRQTTRDYYTEQDFELYNSLTDNSSEIECLFVERTKQLLKDGGVAGVILPSSILSNSGIYTKAREIILQYFDIIAIAELGSNTFMATNTNTVVMFLRRKDNYLAINTKVAVDTYFRTLNDVTINGIETPALKYVAYVWEGLDYADYVTLLQKSPNDKVKAHEVYIEYRKKLSSKSDVKILEEILNIEAEKLLYFILAYPQKVVIVKSGEKNVEKCFLGYEFSNRRGNEGIHAIQRGKNIDECTQLFDANSYDNPLRASTYIYKAFKGDVISPIAEDMQSHVNRISLIDMLNFDRPIFEKGINLNSKKKVVFNSTYILKPLDELVTFQNGLWKGDSGKLQTVKALRNTNFKLNNGFLDYSDVAEIDVEATQLLTRTLQYGDIILEKSGGSATQAIGRVVLFDKNDDEIYSYSNFCSRIRVNNACEVNPLYLWIILHNFYNQGGTIPLQNGIRLLNIDMVGYSKIKIPVPPIDIQKQIVEEIGKVDMSTSIANSVISNKISDIKTIINGLVPTVGIKEYFDINTKVLNPASCWENEHFTYVDIDSVGKGDGNISFDKIILGKDAPSRARRVAQDRTVIISTVRPYLKGFAYIENVPNKIIFSTGFALLRSKNEENYISKLLYYLFMFSDDLMRQMETAMPKAAYPSINKDDIGNFRIPMPSINEQKRIISQIEALELEINNARTTIENTASEKQAILDKYL
ncbi:N-6 DNA methylase [Prevotella intermedia]|uniref:site-specific DNA-methyltransferase (adenine-specific) n=1 Tax=Prevotella intermedia TaxID=28131 RepID=A0A2G9II21_PREIN|nr:N-6 DNA methylase [Prevotella intermedia]PIN29240.1 restriction endonuclease subunit S [Prevotella intermedia]